MAEMISKGVDFKEKKAKVFVPENPPIERKLEPLFRVKHAFALQGLVDRFERRVKSDIPYRGWLVSALGRIKDAVEELDSVLNYREVSEVDLNSLTSRRQRVYGLVAPLEKDLDLQRDAALRQYEAALLVGLNPNNPYAPELREVLRGLPTDQRSARIYEAIKDGDIAVVSAALLSPTLASGLTPEGLASFREMWGAKMMPDLADERKVYLDAVEHVQSAIDVGKRAIIAADTLKGAIERSKNNLPLLARGTF